MPPGGRAAAAPGGGRRHRVLMVSDFFYPNFGGVENHIYQLSQCLLAAGHKVVVMTHAYGNCQGVRYLTNGLKVYYIPRRPFYAQSTLPTVAGNMQLLRAVLARERITLLHAHQAFSALGIEALVHARTMGYRAVFTDHSLFGFADAASIATNKLLKAALADANAVICVSHTSRENTVLRACLPPARVSVIPNAVDASDFKPPSEEERARRLQQEQQMELQRLEQQRDEDTEAAAAREANGVPMRRRSARQRDAAASPADQLRRRQQQEPDAHSPWAKEQQQQQQQQQQDGALPREARGQQEGQLPPLTVVALSRLVYRKGVDLLALVIPEVCARHPNVRFVIGGDGPKRRLLEEVVRQGGLEGRVALLGAVPHERAREVLIQGEVFVNASLTEAFCMAIVEAASAGLLVVSTRVGGVPEVLPPDMLLLCEPSAEGLLASLEEALWRVARGRDPRAQHERVRDMYNWSDVAARTLRVYDAAMDAPWAEGLLPRLRRCARAGPWAGPLWCCVLVMLHWWWRLLEWSQPAAGIERAPDWPVGAGCADAADWQAPDVTAAPGVTAAGGWRADAAAAAAGAQPQDTAAAATGGASHGDEHGREPDGRPRRRRGQQ